MRPRCAVSARSAVSGSKMAASATVLLFLALVMPTRAAATETLPSVPAEAAPGFELVDLDGRLHRLADYRGKVVILNFWATWCPPCREEMPAMERAQQALEGEDIVILAINVGEDEDTIFTFTADYPVTFPLLMDRDAEVIDEYQVVGLPTTFVIDPAGRIIHRVVGTREWDDSDLLDRLRALLRRAPVGPASAAAHPG